MAARLIARRPSAACDLVEKFAPIRSIVPVSARSFADSADPSEERSVDIARRPSDDVAVPRRGRRGGDLLPSFLADVFDPFTPRRSLSEMFNLMDQLMDFPFASGRGVGVGGMGLRRGWDAWEDEKVLYLKFDMPGLSKEDVTVRVDGNTLVIKGEAAAEGEVGEGGDAGGEEEEEAGEQLVRRRYSTRLDLPERQYDLQGIRAEMKNGVLKVAVPKVKEEERKDVRHVEIE